MNAPQLLTGGAAVAHAMRQIDPDVVPVYPITPQTPIIQTFAKFVADGRAHAELVDVESEHSAMSAAVAIPVTRFVAPGPDVASATPTRPDARAYPSAMCAAPCSWRTSTCRIEYFSIAS